MKNKFFGSKLNSVLLLVLIILMVVALFVMFKDKEKYFPEFIQDGIEQTNKQEKLKEYKNNELGFSFKYFTDAKITSKQENGVSIFKVFTENQKNDPEQIIFYPKGLPNNVDLCNDSEKIIVINKKDFSYCSIGTEDYTDHIYFYKKDNKAIVVNVDFTDPNNVQNLIDIGSIEIN